ncbi:ring finger-like protein [Thermochaetoides thermophila DSM 1495]|uniref:Ring finger-like protein n=1 Tax=Chaetomium thermophilum (strain DSM 1495 / CBS 144.50 / IMI 039719) TaxID=759272 RepID=G0SD58_CHATD|nr:ring finger-like protein [Thermochaetoides thermophila DSM 1495]EGS19278.1 ring finger-like protein [Thermochaetoides thermophila DSM 1495]
MSMSLEEIRNVILLFSSPSWTGPSVISSTIIRNITASHMAYTTRFTPNLTTTILSSHYSYSSPSEEGIIQGLLYVPDLPPNKDHDICIALTAPHIPPTAVRQYNLPPTNYHLIAIAPWVSDRCAGAYLKAVRGESAVKGFIFYMPGDNDDEMLGKKDLLITDDDSDDGGGDDDGDDDNNWMVRIKHPVFAVSGSIGELMMQHMSLYSGNMTEVPFGQDIRKKFNTHEHDYLRVWTELVVKTPPAPSNDIDSANYRRNDDLDGYSDLRVLNSLRKVIRSLPPTGLPHLSRTLPAPGHHHP